MKLSAKQILFVVLCLLLITVVVLSGVLVSRLSGLVQLAFGPGPGTEPTVPSVTPTGSEIASAPTTLPTVAEDSHAHQLTAAKVVPPTCTDFGYTLLKCTGCDKEETDHLVSPLGHQLGQATVVPATCEEDGYTQQTCSRCKENIRSNIQEASHQFSQWEQANVELGTHLVQQEGRNCSVCHATEWRSNAALEQWVIRCYFLEPQADFSCYKIVVDLSDEDEDDPVYYIYSALADQTAAYYYYEGGLQIGYMVDGQPKIHVVTTPGSHIVIHTDGRVAYPIL